MIPLALPGSITRMVNILYSANGLELEISVIGKTIQVHVCSLCIPVQPVLEPQIPNLKPQTIKYGKNNRCCESKRRGW